MSVRVSVAVGIVFLGAIGLASLAEGFGARRCRLPAPGWRRTAGISLALILAGLIVQLAEPAPWARVTLDWLPGVYLLAGYWLPAQLRHRPAPRLQAHLEAADRAFFASAFGRCLDRTPRLVLEYLEAAYLGCYVIVPAALAWAYFSGHTGEADPFWTAVLLAAFPCYALVALCETRPPRCVGARSPTTARPLAIRSLNLAVLDRVSIGFNTFPSGHAAASFAAALAVGAAMPAAGGILAILAVSIALGSVVGRYHYALDAASGALLAIVAFGLSRLV